MKGKEKIEEFLKEIEKELGRLPEDLHVTRMCCGLIAVSEGKIIKAEKPRLKYCPLRAIDDLYKFKNFDLKEVCDAVRLKTSKFCHFTRERELCRESIAIPYGASEMMKYALEKKGIDSTVTLSFRAKTTVSFSSWNICPIFLQNISIWINVPKMRTTILETSS